MSQTSEQTQPAAQTPIPVASLRLEVHPTNPPRPIGFGVFADDKLIAVLSIDEVRNAYRKVEAVSGE